MAAKERNERPTVPSHIAWLEGKDGGLEGIAACGEMVVMAQEAAKAKVAVDAMVKPSFQLVEEERGKERRRMLPQEGPARLYTTEWRDIVAAPRMGTYTVFRQFWFWPCFTEVFELSGLFQGLIGGKDEG